MNESLEQMVARINASAFLPPTASWAMPRKRGRRKHRVTRKFEQLLPADQRLLRELLAGRAFLVYIDGTQYAVLPLESETRVRTLQPGAVVRIVRDGACSCPDSKFRGRVCKHARAAARVKHDGAAQEPAEGDGA